MSLFRNFKSLPGFQQFPLYVFLLALSVTMVTGFVFHYRMMKTEEIRDRLVLEISDLQTELSRSNEGKQILEQYLPVFRKAGTAGWWTPQDRLAWLEKSNGLASQSNIVDLHYTLSSPRTIGEKENFVITAVGMDLEFGLIHGAQLLDFWRVLSQSSLGPFSLEECKVVRQQNPEEQGKGNLEATCHLEWFAVLKHEWDETEAMEMENGSMGDMGGDDIPL